ncbi:winged helix-turn-helix transcriptional regulator [Actinomadura rudentiformis]|uniref:Transcriptional regulator n=1 Tax=Actinomadura rudentiformis TaxID=359158 RepID=A0A6H9Y625_9ACTN|nr:winged helix-turn-helix transcriptional regulator [Actinomadura rudentiformis]KAB2339614.1 transcriptional regulator [Actinomadura rudentiformis]
MEQRTYNQYCATARTLDIVGERWTLLLIRELMTGPRRFGDLQNSLRGLGTGLLSARLKHLEREGLARKITLPPPARTPAYALTDAGEELAPAVLALATWGMKWAMGERREGEVFHPGWAVLGLRTCFVAEAAAGLRVVYEFRVGDEVFYADIDDGTIETAHGPAQRPDLVIETDDATFLEVFTRGRGLADAIKNGEVAVTGDREALGKLRVLFKWPEQGHRKPAS